MGPAFYDLVNADANPFAAQMAFLGGINESHNVLALGAQDMLREGYLNPASGGLSGISAMPSLHNATSTLFMLAAYRIHKNFGHVMLAFLMCIIIGSVRGGCLCRYYYRFRDMESLRRNSEMAG